MNEYQPLTPAQLEQSEEWAGRNTAPYPLGAYLETIRARDRELADEQECRRKVVVRAAHQERDLADYRRIYGCISCGQYHPAESMCPPHEVRITGQALSEQRMSTTLRELADARASLASYQAGAANTAPVLERQQARIAALEKAANSLLDARSDHQQMVARGEMLSALSPAPGVCPTCTKPGRPVPNICSDPWHLQQAPVDQRREALSNQRCVECGNVTPMYPHRNGCKQARRGPDGFWETSSRCAHQGL